MFVKLGIPESYYHNCHSIVTYFKFRNRFLLDPSYASVEELSFGRIAFHGMNPEIEKMMENERLRKEQADAIR